jgi:hypothetical protein
MESSCWSYTGLWIFAVEAIFVDPSNELYKFCPTTFDQLWFRSYFESAKYILLYICKVLLPHEINNDHKPLSEIVEIGLFGFRNWMVQFSRD